MIQLNGATCAVCSRQASRWSIIGYRCHEHRNAKQPSDLVYSDDDTIIVQSEVAGVRQTVVVVKDSDDEE